MTLMYALVVACLAGAPEPMACVAVGDHFGPYETEKACTTRLEEMRVKIMPQLVRNFKSEEFSYKERCNTVHGHTFEFKWINTPETLNNLFGESLKRDEAKS